MHNSRARVLRMTRKGERVYAGIVPLAQKIEAELQAGFSRTEWTLLRRALTKLSVKLNDLSNAEVEADPD